MQTGAYSKKAYAQEQVAKLKKAGFSSYITTKSGKAVSEGPKERTGTVTVASTLNIRSGPGTSYSRTGSLKNGTKVTIVEEKNGWGKLKQGGWVSLQYVK